MENYDINKQQSDDIKDLKDCIKHFVPSKIVLWIAGILILFTTTLFGYSLSSINSMETKIEKTYTQYISIEAQLAKIQIDLIWIKKELDRK